MSPFRRTLVVVATLMMLVSTSALCQDTAADKKLLSGAWKPVSAELAGQDFVGAKALTLVVVGDNYTVTIGKTVDKGTLMIDPTAKPKAMDITGVDGPNKGKTFPAIYEVEKDTLRICYDLNGKNRPTEFATSKEKPFFLVVYQRAK